MKSCIPQESASSKPSLSTTGKEAESSLKTLTKTKPLRLDLVNKTVMRSIKRFYTQLFESFNPDFNYSPGKENASIFEEQTTTFTQSLFCSDDPELISKNITLQSIAAVLRMLICPELAKSINKARTERALLTSYSDVIYKYSHKRLLKLTKNSTFSYLFLKFITKGGFTSLVMNDDTMGQNPCAYLKAAENMEKLFN